MKAVIFDLDGTLIDSIEDLADSTNEALKKFSFPTHSIDKYKYLVGDGIEVLAKKAAPIDTNDKILKEMVDIILSHYSANWNNKTTVYDGIDEMLKGLKENRIPISVLTNKREDFAVKIVHHFFPSLEFDYIVGSSSNKKAKPDPTKALEIASKYKISPENIYFVGDTSVDIKTAINAKMFPIGVLWGFRAEKELIDTGAKKIVSKPEQILDIVINNSMGKKIND